MADINDVFDDIFMSEEKFVKLGYEEGIRAGENDEESYRQGVNTGVQKAFEISNELGYYWAFATVWSNHFITQSLQHVKLLALLGSIRKGVEEVMAGLKDINVHNKLLILKAKHRQACASLKVKNTMEEVDKGQGRLDF